MSSYSSTGSHFSIMDDASTASTSRSRSNSLFENPTTHTVSETRRRSNSLFDSPTPSNSHRRTNSIKNNTMVQAMITSNNLRNCREVQEMVVQCLNNKDDKSFMCQTAQRYIGGCQK